MTAISTFTRRHIDKLFQGQTKLGIIRFVRVVQRLVIEFPVWIFVVPLSSLGTFTARSTGFESTKLFYRYILAFAVGTVSVSARLIVTHGYSSLHFFMYRKTRMDREWIEILGLGLLATLNDYQGPKHIKKMYSDKIKEVLNAVSDCDSDTMPDV